MLGEELDADVVLLVAAFELDEDAAIVVEVSFEGDEIAELGLATDALVDAAARLIAARAAFFRAAEESDAVTGGAGMALSLGVDEEGEELSEAGLDDLHLWVVGNRCSAQNC